MMRIFIDCITSLKNQYIVDIKPSLTVTAKVIKSNNTLSFFMAITTNQLKK
jgi:hypothetical protein